jgi:peptide deformylase
MILPIVLYGSPILRKKSEEITKDYPQLSTFISDMFETMYKSDGIGLAAPQVNKSIRVFIVDTAPLKEDDPSLANFKKVFINPVITSKEGEKLTYNEGCLSIPTIKEDIVRPSIVKLEFYDEQFNFHSETFAGVRARVIQHEYDHLEGILFTDLLAPLKRKLLYSKLNNISKGKIDVSYKVKAVR